MTPSTTRTVPRTSGLRRASAGAAALAVACALLAGCSVVSQIHKIEHTVEGNKATVDAFTQKIQNGEATPFEATYVTSGSSPATVVYAVRPPTDLAFSLTPTGGGPSTKIVVNSTGEYACVPGTSGSSSWTCTKLPQASAKTENEIFDFYTAAHWVEFLRDFSLVAGLAGDKVSQSSMTVNGVAMSCVDFVAAGEPGTSTICTTPQGVLGYVKVAGDSTTFEITSYTTSPPDSDFELPAGATITTTPTSAP